MPRTVRYYWLFRRMGFSLLRAFATVFVVSFISFVLVRLSPYSPVTALLGGGALLAGSSVKAEVAYYYSLYPTGPLYTQFLNYFWAVIHGNLGHSITNQLPVTQLIAEALPWTLLIVISSTLISFGIGTILGMMMAYKRGAKGDTGAITALTVSSSIPVYFVALVLLVLLTFTWHIFPHGGTYGISDSPGLSYPFIASVAYHAFLPILTLVIVNVGGWALTMRAITVSILGEDYVLAAEIRGLPNFSIATLYVGRNAILPQFTNLVLALGFSFAGAVFVEEIFSYPGMGYLLINAVELNNYPVIMGVFLTYIIAVVAGLFVVELTYGLLDPRIRRG